MIFLGIDPGMNGAVSVIDNAYEETDPRYCTSINFKNLTPKDIADQLRIMPRRRIFCVIESVHSMPRQGVASSFKFGRSFGLLEGILWTIEIPFEHATPQAWQKYMGCMTRGDKNVSKAKAQQLFPRMKITHANADSVLLAEYARRVWLGFNGKGLESALGDIPRHGSGVIASADLKKLINTDVFANCEKK